jgi:hypothetical protein
MSPFLRSASAPLTISEAIAEGGMYQVVFCDHTMCDTVTYYAASDPALRFVVRDALAIASDLMDRQKRSLLDLQVYEYSRYVVKVYGQPDKKTSVMPFLGVFRLGDIGKYMLAAGMNFDDVLDDPVELFGCVSACSAPEARPQA